MTRTRIFSTLVALALALTAALVVRQGLLTARVVEAAGQAAAQRQADPGVCAYFHQDINNLRSVHDPARGISVARSDSGVLGVDGGLMAIKDC
jgi:hypothetical protein